METVGLRTGKGDLGNAEMGEIGNAESGSLGVLSGRVSRVLNKDILVKYYYILLLYKYRVL